MCKTNQLLTIDATPFHGTVSGDCTYGSNGKQQN